MMNRSIRRRIQVTVEREDGVDLVKVDGKTIGPIIDGYFTQNTTLRHIFWELNSKGIEVDVYERLLHTPGAIGWRLYFKDTKQILSIPLRNIPEVAILNPPHSAGYQYHVKLHFFNQDQPALQKSMF